MRRSRENSLPVSCSGESWRGKTDLISVICWFSCVLLLLIDKASLQEIEAVVGHNIILPCSNSDDALQNKPTAFWRFRDSRTVYDIIDSRASFDEQDASFRGRVESFPAEWTKGNFSITLSSVEKADGGPYTCFIPAFSKETKVQLIVKERPVAQTVQRRNGDVRTVAALSVRAELRNGDAGRRTENRVLFSAALLGLTLLCWFSCVLLLLIDKASLQEIEAVVGHNIILPCSNGDDALQNKPTAFWRFRDSRTVYDIIDSRASFDEQDASFRGRVESFPAEWTKGNFSITLSSVEKADGGPYTCFIPAFSKETKVQLIVKGL
ncbi:hypothetical protein AOLI_G00289310 [Acnodon oligacanthus]